MTTIQALLYIIVIIAALYLLYPTISKMVFGSTLSEEEATKKAAEDAAAADEAAKKAAEEAAIANKLKEEAEARAKLTVKDIVITTPTKRSPQDTLAAINALGPVVEFVGVYKDVGTDRALKSVNWYSATTLAHAVKQAVEKSKSLPEPIVYIGLQYGGEVWPGYANAQYSKHGVQTDSSKIETINDYKWGKGGTNAVYKLKWEPSTV